MTLLAILLEQEGKEAGPLINDQTLIALMVIGGMVLVAILVVAFSVWLTKFRREYQHLCQRIKQAASERERQHYIRRRRNLFLSIIPFVRYKHR